MNTKWYSLLSIILLFSLLAACGGGGSSTGSAGETPGNGGTGTNGGAETPPASQGKTTVQFWHSLGGKNGEYTDALIQRFNAAHSDIEVVGTFQGGYDETVTKLQQAIASGTGPDVSMLERAYVQMFADSEVLEDLTPYMEGSGISADDFTPGLMGHSVFNDQLVSLPLNRSTPILHVNKSMLDEAGLEIPTTWEEMREVAGKLAVKEGNEYKRYGLTMPYDTWYPIAMITQAGGKFFNDEGTTIGFGDNGAGHKVFSYLKDLQSSGALYYPPAQDSGNIVNSMFVEGKVGMMFQSTGSIGGLSSTVDFDYVTAFLPKDEVFANPTGGANVTMLAASKHKEAAWEFIRWMEMEEEGGLEFILQSGYLPFTKKMVESEKMQALWAEEPNRKVAYDQLEHAIDTNKDVAWPEIMHEFFSAIEAIMYDSKDIDSTIDTFRKETERILGQ
ncbi:ABC transporter substrate-binding protein [Paenibacillus sp. JCM 10914]|uniref:ABC transporter substrate-binding protein n=1 Tax=Paenibacillus sp. JCM 10914 TaxID=1236974 RepID=UPI0003CC425E|nr:ABC transporter substrate-binding protein [Paenibacillus sp. JCM 10914]GAE07728.1 glycerol-3-phosphate ABC transporter, periplasmic glycerol-3-phosphate-binding protein [Paenibacillus sp. JCM 10914]